MAGVGFELQKLLRKGTLFSTIQAFLYGSILASGPVILTIVTVGIIGWMSYGLLQTGVLRLFTVTIVYTFVFSLILTGPTQLLFTRFVADKHFTKEFDHIYPGFLTSAALVSILALSVAVPFYSFLEVYIPVGNLFLYKLFGILTFLGVCLIWQLMGFISASKEYHKVVRAYLGGTILSILAAYLLVSKITVAGALAGFCVGQWFIAIALFRISTKKLEKKHYWRKEYFQYFVRYKPIALNGLIYNLGFWADKLLFWAHFKQQQGASLFYTYNYYDVPNFLAFLTIIPALAYFLILTETNFYKDYSGFVHDVLHQPLLIIQNKKQDMIATLKEGMRGMVKLQCIVTLLLIIFAEPILVFLGYRGVSIRLFRILLIGVFFHVINLNLNIIFLYYEMRVKALYLTVLFAVTNTIFTLVSIRLGIPYFGLGFLCATLVTFAVSWPLLMYSIKRIDFAIFASQPIDAVVQTTKKRCWWKLRRLARGLRNQWIDTNHMYPEYHN